MAGLSQPSMPFSLRCRKDMDARDKPGHDDRTLLDCFVASLLEDGE